MKKAELAGYIDAAVDESLAGCETKNPLEAWTRFIDRLDAIGRQNIGDALEQRGRNRYTGEARENGKRDAEPEPLLEQGNPER